jgi:cellulose synthase/poly-beta-1,6-N-acetylglucosamine synthase-like glycosyltransferase
MINCSIGVLAHNEAQNIGHLLQALCEQKLKNVNIYEIIVVSSASRDATDEIVNDYAKKYDHIRLISEPERQGKAAAINTFLKEAKSDIVVIESGDTIPAEDTIEKLVSPFADEKVGMTGGRPMPVNDESSFIGYSVHLLWRLHHKMALYSAKLGEMVAFRKVIDSIPVDSAVDEASIESEIISRNLTLKYIPDAIIHNKGPETISDFIKQRRRIQAGHLWLKRTQNYSVASQNSSVLFKLTLDEIKENPKKLPLLLGTIILEIWGRILGYYDLVIKKRNPYKWDIAKTTKKLR